jgi:hypothetical protein
MNTTIRKLILPVFSVCALIWIVGPARARGDFQLSLDSSTPTTVYPGEIVPIVYDITNTSTTDTLYLAANSISAHPQPGTYNVTISPETPPATTLGPLETTQATFSMVVPAASSPSLTGITLDYSLTYDQSPTHPQQPIKHVLTTQITDPLTPSAAPEPNTLVLAGLGGGCWLVYAMARKRRHTLDRSARS